MTFEDAHQLVREFREARDWDQFHNAKGLAIAISGEAAELLEIFLWSGTDLEVGEQEAHIREELADVLIYCLHMVDHLDADPAELIAAKMAVNELKYPVEKARGTASKYSEL